MKLVLNSALFLLMLFMTQNCSPVEVYDQKIRTLDSLSGAVNAMAVELSGIDTGLLKRSVSKYRYYKQFIKQRVNDTLNKVEADQLKQFFAGGEKLENFEKNRATILARTKLLNSQLVKLTEDARSRSASGETLSQFVQQEYMEAGKLVRSGYSQQKIFYQALEDFRNSIKGVEQLIMIRNNGQLPTIMRDTINI
jgi:hypothetical protein